jgi:hypothetical protein
MRCVIGEACWVPCAEFDLLICDAKMLASSMWRLVTAHEALGNHLQQF